MNAYSLDLAGTPSVRPATLENRDRRASAGPVILRELATEARNRSNYGLRILSGAGLMILFAIMMRYDSSASVSLSARLFTAAHTLLWLALWIIGPILTADAISKENREGTLGLLFSTNLNTREIVLGKGFVHMTRLATVWLAAFPIVLIPLLLGGVTWLDLLSAFMLEFCAGLWSLAAGLVISSLGLNPMWSLLLAISLAFGFFEFFKALVGIAWLSQLNLLGLANASPALGPNLPALSLALCTGVGQSMLGWSRQTGPAWLLVLGELLVLSFGAFYFLLRFAAYRTERVWRREPPSARQLKRRETWLAPRFWLGRFRQQRRRWLERNPLGWLHQQSVWARFSKLGWCGIVLFIESFVMLNARPWTLFDCTQLWMSIALSLHMTFVAVMAFRQERDTGVLELLLVTPISVEQILFRELCAFWKRFFLPVVLLISLSELMLFLDLASPSQFDSRMFLLLNFVTTPIIGFFASAKFRGFAPAFLMTAFFALGLPLLGPDLGPGFLENVTTLNLWFLSRWPAPSEDSALLISAIRLTQLGVAAVCWFRFKTILLERSSTCLHAPNPRSSAR